MQANRRLKIESRVTIPGLLTQTPDATIELPCKCWTQSKSQIRFLMQNNIFEAIEQLSCRHTLRDAPIP